MFLSIACVGSFTQFRQNFTEEKARYSTLPLVGHFPEDFKLTSSMISVFDEHVPPCTDNSNCKNSSGPPCHPRCDPTLRQPATVPTTDNDCHVAMCPHPHHQDPSANLGRLLHRRAPTPTPSRLTYPQGINAHGTFFFHSTSLAGAVLPPAPRRPARDQPYGCRVMPTRLTPQTHPLPTTSATVHHVMPNLPYPVNLSTASIHPSAK